MLGFLVSGQKQIRTVMARHTEFQSCCALMQWWTFYARINKIPEFLLLHIANQSAGGVRNGVNLKRMGVRQGTPDYLLAVARKGKHGLWIEMKSADGRIRPEQTIALEELAKQGYETALCRSTDEARTVIELYLK